MPSPREGDEIIARLSLAADVAVEDGDQVIGYAELVAQDYRRIVARRIGEKLLAAARDPNASFAEALVEAGSGIDALIGKGVGGDRSFGTYTDVVIDKTIDVKEGRVPAGITSGIHSLDDLVGPLGANDLVVLGAHSGAGKTSLSTQLALRASKG